jgi:hypothetical protein
MRPAVLAAGLWVALQIVIPVWQLTHAPVPSRFSWQMYARSPRPYRFVGLYDKGDTKRLGISRLLWFRYELRPERYVPALVAQL